MNVRAVSQHPSLCETKPHLLSTPSRAPHEEKVIPFICRYNEIEVGHPVQIQSHFVEAAAPRVDDQVSYYKPTADSPCGIHSSTVHFPEISICSFYCLLVLQKEKKKKNYPPSYRSRSVAVSCSRMMCWVNDSRNKTHARVIIHNGQ